MINCLFIKISQNSRGVAVRSYRTINADELTLGRGAECTIHLADPRINMHHAVIKRNENGQIQLCSINGELQVESQSQPNVTLTYGTQVMIGPYLLTVEPAPPDVDLSVSLSLIHKLPDDYEALKKRTQNPLPGASRFKRKLSLWLAACIALIFLVMPLAQVFIPIVKKSATEWPVGFDRVWSPGRISNAHRHFASQCVNCHQAATKQVNDQACTHCHTNTEPHIANSILQAKAFQPHRLFANNMRCAECHLEHKAPHPLTRQNNQLCVNCHGNIKAVNPDTALPDIHDFDHDHPAFKLTFQTNADEKKSETISQSETARLVENSGLNFPHVQHVGKVQGPNGMDDIRELSCTTCHQPEGKSMKFTPISFKRDCVSCHQEQLQVGTLAEKLTVPHGSETNVFNTLKLYAPKQFSKYSELLKTEGCAYCHQTTEVKQTLAVQLNAESKKSSPPLASEVDAPLWRVSPITINHDWFRNARFNHASHNTQQCQSCHNVENSESSADIAMPDRASCLSCHSGDSPKPKRIASSCMSCHNFHHGNTIQGVPMRIEDKDVKAVLSMAEKNSH